MLLQTNSYVVPKERRTEHARLMKRFRQVLGKLGCEEFEVYEQVGANWTGGNTTDRFVQFMRFRDRKQHAALQAAERSDPAAQQLIAEFCELVNFPYQQQQGFFAVGFYNSLLQPQLPRGRGPSGDELPAEGDDTAQALAPTEEAAPAPDAALAAETQAYAAETEAESHEPGHLTEADARVGAEGDDVPFAEHEALGEPTLDEAPLELIDETPAHEPEPPAEKGSLFRRRKPG